MYLRPHWKRKTHKDVQSHEGEVLATAVSTDGRYIAGGGRDRKVRIYDSRSNDAEVAAFEGHRDAITSLCFKEDSYTLYSVALDRLVDSTFRENILVKYYSLLIFFFSFWILF